MWLFANQTLYTGLIAKAGPGIGDIAFFVGFVIAAVLYAAIHTVERKAGSRRRPSWSLPREAPAAS